MTALNLRELDARAVRASIAVVSQVHPDDLGRATPCSDWTLGRLLAHMTAQHRGFAAAARGRGGDLSIWEVQAPGGDAVAAYVKATEEVLAAFGADGVLEREFALPEITTSRTFPAQQAIGFHFIDYVVHTWDVARAVGAPYVPEPELLPAALQMAQAVPDGPNRLVPGAVFSPALPAPEGADLMDRILLMLGRSPRWPE